MSDINYAEHAKRVKEIFVTLRSCPLRSRFYMMISLEKIVGMLCGVSSSLLLLFLVNPGEVYVRESFGELDGYPLEFGGM